MAHTQNSSNAVMQGKIKTKRSEYERKIEALKSSIEKTREMKQKAALKKPIQKETVKFSKTQIAKEELAKYK